MAQPPGAQQQQQVIYLVMDESQQGQQIQFIDGQPTLVMAPGAGVSMGAGGAAALANPSTVAANSESQVLLVSEDGQLVTGNEGQVVLDDQGQVVMTTDEGQQVALETEHLNVSNDQPGQIQYVLSSESTTTSTKSSILSQAGSIITGGQVGAKATNGSAKDEDGYTTIVIGGNQPAVESSATSEGYKTILIDSNTEATAGVNSMGGTKVTTHQSHPILSHQLNLTQSPSKSPGRATSESPRAKPAMVSILDKARLATLTQQANLQQNTEVSLPKPVPVAAPVEAAPQPPVTEVTMPPPEPIENETVAELEQETQPMEVETSIQEQPIASEEVADQIGQAQMEVATEDQSLVIDSNEAEPPQQQTEEEQMIHIENIPLSDSAEVPESNQDHPAITLSSDNQDIQDTAVSASNATDVLQEPTEVVLQQEPQVLADDAVATEVDGVSQAEEPEQEVGGAQLDTVESDVYMTETVEAPDQLTDSDGVTTASDPASTTLKADANDMVRSLEDYMTRRPVEPEQAQQEEVEEVEANTAPMEPEVVPPPQEEEDMGDIEEPSGFIEHVCIGTLLGPLRYDSDDSGPEVDSFEPALTIDTSEPRPVKPKPADKRRSTGNRSSVEEKQAGSESDTGSRRRSSRNKSPKRYSEEPIIFGDDWTKPAEPKPPAPTQDSAPRKKGRPPKKRPYYVYEEIETSESEGIIQSEEEEPLRIVADTEKVAVQPPKKRLGRPGADTEKRESEDDSKRDTDTPEETLPRKRGRPPKKRFLEKHNSEEGLSAEEKSKETEPSEDEVSSGRMKRKSFDKKPTPVSKTWNFRRSTNERKFDTSPKEPTVLTKMGEKKLATENTKEEILDHFGFNEDSEKEEEIVAPQVIQITIPETLLVQKKEDLPSEVKTDSSSEVVADEQVEKDVQVQSAEGIQTSPTKKAEETPASPEKSREKSPKRAVDTEDDQATPSKKAAEAKPARTPASEAKAKAKYTEAKPGSSKAERSMGTTSLGDRKLGINFKSMKFSVSKRLNTTPESKKIFTSAKKVSPPVPNKTSQHIEAVEKDMQYRDAALTKREQKIRALDTELDHRASQLRVKEAKLDRLQRKLKETENNLEYRERRIKREEQALENEKDSSSKTPKDHRKRSKPESPETESQELSKKEKTLKDLEKKLAAQEKELQKREEKVKQETEELDHKKELLAATEQQLTALSKELSEKYKYLQDQDQTSEPSTTQPAKASVRQGLFEKIASLGKATELALLQQPKDEGKREREDEEEEGAQPPKKRTKTEVQGKKGASEEKADSKPSFLHRLTRHKKDKPQKQQKKDVKDTGPQQVDSKKQLKSKVDESKEGISKPSVVQRLAMKGVKKAKTRARPPTGASSTASPPSVSRQSSRTSTSEKPTSSSTGGKKATPTVKAKATKAQQVVRKSNSVSQLPRATSSSSVRGGGNKDKKVAAAKAKSTKTPTPKQVSRTSLRANTRHSLTPKGRKK